MGLYDGIKDVAKVMQQADNIELYKQLIDLSAQALDMQAEIASLKEENAKLKQQKDLSENIVRHMEPYITLKDEEPSLRYCSHCWDSEKLLIQLNCDEEDYTFFCPHCDMQGKYNTQELTSLPADIFGCF